MAFNFDQLKTVGTSSEKKTSGFNFDSLPTVSSSTAPTSAETPQQELPSWAADIDAAYTPNATAQKIGEYGRAALTGVSDMTATVIGDTAKGGTYLLEKIGAISPKTKQQVNTSLDNLFKYGKKEAVYAGDPFAQAAKDHPYVTGTAQVLTALPLYTSTMAPESLIGGSKLLAGGLNAGISGLQSAGSVSDLPQEAQDSAAKWGAGIYAGLGAIGSGISSLTNTPIAKKELTQIAKPYMDDSVLRKASSLVENKASEVLQQNKAYYDTLKSIPGTINKYQPNSLISGLLKDTNSLLTPVQKSHLIDIASSLENADDMSKVIDLRNVINDGTNLFSAKASSPNAASASVRSTYKAILKSMDNQIGEMAANAGLKTDLKTALDYYANKVVPLKKAGAIDLLDLSKKASQDPMWQKAYLKKLNSFFSGFGTDAEKTKAILPMLGGKGEALAQQVGIQKFFGNLLESPAALEPNALLSSVNKWEQQFGKVLSPDNRKVFLGAKKLLESMGAVSGQVEDTAASHLAQRLIGIGAGSGLAGAVVGGTAGAVIGAPIGVLGTMAAMKGFKTMLNSPVGLHILKGIAEGRPWLKATKKALSTMTPEDLIRMQYPEDNNEEN